jgi:hypothetical protein
VEIANAVEPMQDGRIFVELLYGRRSCTITNAELLQNMAPPSAR